MTALNRLLAKHISCYCAWILLLWYYFISVTCASAQVVLKGRLLAPQHPGSDVKVPITAVYCFANQTGSDNQALAFRTWETHPAGWYYLAGDTGNYTLVFSDPSGYMRPLVRTNQFVLHGDIVDRIYAPEFDYADFTQSAWDTKPATDYNQTFVARGSSITQVGFKLATDGVDGPGPQKQNILISIHRKSNGTPDAWSQIGPASVVLNVDCGGPKNYWWSAGWNSIQVPTTPGQTYAVHLCAETPGNSFQAFWRPVENSNNDCYRIGNQGKTGWQKRNLCMTVASDCDNLLIPYNKCVQQKFLEFAGFDKSWSQTYIAQGRSLASVILYAATSGVQPSINRQRVKVRIRKDGPDGPVVGVEKIAIGNGNYTGDASWGVFGATFAPGEVPLIPGATYAVEFESIENYNTLHGYVNIKGMVSDDKPGFNPYRKVSPDNYDDGAAFRKGKKRQGFDLDMQIVEYQHSADHWELQVNNENLLKNGAMEQGINNSDSSPIAQVNSWKYFRLDPGTQFQWLTEEKNPDNHIVRIYGGDKTKTTVNGGLVQKVSGLGKVDTYRLSGQIRSTWPVDEKHACMIGYDPTGQDQNPNADTIQWTILPAVHGQWIPYTSPPIRPQDDSLSIYLRARTSLTVDHRFEADFDSFALQKVNTLVPTD